ncbi:transcriptional regulator [Phytoactinopolyspora halotolerans]|uniref:Transcriptional regulator n=1 Tax=Phytoactinopolyspora halotolerans TaxID=1981512 RepID=A0A6L9SGU3_9ACTN|nr:transcriptional regulator [Phytoactinopolyspora halotolerans]NEE04333.1 transcriptional regulator [Phytoactinopolyspora halotolerans]
MHGSNGAREEVTIGVVGAAEAIERIMSVARDTGSSWWRLVAAAYTDEADAHAQFVKIASRIDVCLFSGPLPYDMVTGTGGLSVPAAYVPVDGAAIHGTLLRGILGGVFDPTRISIDSVAKRDVMRTYAEIGLSSQHVRVLPYSRPGSADEFLGFHQTRYELGETTGAVTTVPTVAAALASAGVPVLTMAPAETTVRHALQTAGLIGSQAKLEGARIVTVIVRVPTSMLPPHPGPSSYSYQESKLSLYRELLREARPMDAAVLARDERSYLVVTTMGSLRIGTDDLTVAPFVQRISSELGIDVEVGIGLGHSTREAELNAQTAVDKAAAAGDHTAFLLGPAGAVLQLPVERRPEPHVVHPGGGASSKAAETLARLAGGLETEENHVVDAEKVAEILDVRLQTARRALRMLVDEGLAWPMPPARARKVGRPPQLFQLLFEKLHT